MSDQTRAATHIFAVGPDDPHGLPFAEELDFDVR